MILEADLNHIVFMKVGRHAGETFEEILARKRQEYAAAGRIFWGYGGGTMHPLTRVQPFAQMTVVQGERISIVMQEIVSNHPDTEVFAKEYSRNGVTWERIPEGVHVRGSKYALILDELRDGDLNINLGDYEVAAGPSEGKRAEEYIRGRVDKACLRRVRQKDASESESVIPVHVAAHLTDPFAVLLR